MWPSAWIFDCRACFPDPYRCRTLSAALFSSSLFPLHRHISGISPGRSEALKPEPVSSPLSSHKHLLPSENTHTWKHPSEMPRSWNGAKPPWGGAHLKADFPTPSLPVVTFELPADHETFPSHESSPPGNGLLWPSGLCSHGETHYCSHMAGYRDGWDHVSSIFW